MANKADIFRVVKTPILFVSYLDSDYSRSSVYLNNKESKNFEYKFIKISTNFKDICVAFYKIRKNYGRRKSIIVIMSPSHLLTIFARMITGLPIVLDAGWTLYESTALRKKMKFRLTKIIKSYLIDFISFHSADLVFVESIPQSNFTSRLLLLNKRKMKVLFTGFNENALQEEVGNPHNEFITKYNIKLPYVLFRGMYNEESGIETIASASQYCLDIPINFVFLTSNMPPEIKLSPNSIVIKERASLGEIAQLYRKSLICIGQVSNSSRLRRTIPHKAFEAGYFGKPYISMKGEGICSLYACDKSISIIKDNKENELGEAIENLYKSLDARKQLEVNIKKEYELLASQKALQLKFENYLLKFSGSVS